MTEGLLASVPSRQVEGSLIGALSNIYSGHFNLVATKLRDINKAYQVVETARGRSIADALRSEPAQPVRADPITEAARKEVSRIQLALLHETNRDQRANLLERLFQAEQVLAPVGKPESRLQQATIQAHAVGLATLQRSLRPEEAILEYVLDEPSSFCLHVTRSSAAVTVLPAGSASRTLSTDTWPNSGRVRAAPKLAQTSTRCWCSLSGAKNHRRDSSSSRTGDCTFCHSVP